MLILAYFGCERLSTISQDIPWGLRRSKRLQEKPLEFKLFFEPTKA
jgi:hypothetical protein